LSRSAAPVVQVVIPAGWALVAADMAEKFGVERWQSLIAELQKDTDVDRIRALLIDFTTRPHLDQKMIACALALGSNLVVRLDEWLDEDDIAIVPGPSGVLS
jgi:hypothetical protein